MTLNNKQKNRYSVLTALLPASAATMLVVAGSIRRPFSALELLQLGAALLIFLTVATLVVYIRDKATHLSGKKGIFTNNLSGILSMVAVLTVTTAIGLVLNLSTTGNAFLSLVAAYATAVATVRFLALPSGEEAQPADNQVPRPTT